MEKPIVAQQTSIKSNEIKTSEIKHTEKAEKLVNPKNNNNQQLLNVKLSEKMEKIWSSKQPDIKPSERKEKPLSPSSPSRKR